MIYVIYFVFFFMVLRFAVTLFNFLSDPKLRRVNKRYSNLVSILIPARNEAENILALLQSIRDQDYNYYEVIVLDDGSTDRTYQICDAFAKANPKFKVLSGEELPEGWLGKNYACYQLAAQAKGEYLMFIDADELVYNGLVNSAIHRMELNNLSLLSLFTNQVMLSAGENMVVPLMHFVLLNLLPLRLVLLSKDASVSAASGQFMLFGAQNYRKHNWHQLVKDKVVEDVEIMKQIKAAKYNGEALLANGMISCRMYNNYTEAINGFSKNFLAAFNYSISGFMLFIFVMVCGPLLILSTLNPAMIILMLGLIILTRVMISFSSGQSAMVNVLLHPAQMLSMVIIAHYAIQRHLRNTHVWKGRQI